MKPNVYLACLVVTLAAGCSGGGGSLSPEVTPTPSLATATPRTTPTPVATATPHATPTPAPTATPTPMHTATSNPLSSPTPTSSPSAAVPPPQNPVPVPPGPTFTPHPLLTGTAYYGNGQNAGWLPTSIAAAFDYPIGYGFAGSGEKVAIIGSAMASQSDLNTYAQAAALPLTPTVTNVVYQSGNPSPTSDDELETALDVQTVAGLAPAATIYNVDIPQLTEQTIVGALGQVIQQYAPNVVSLSLSACESDSSQENVAYHDVTEEAAAIGITIVAATGDDGPTCYSGTQQIPGVGEPASDPFVVAAGGSEDFLQPPYANAAQATQSLRNPAAWNDNATSGGSGGGGFSAFWYIPGYQNAPDIVSTAASSRYRNLPDVALPASQAGPTAIFQSGWHLVYGTSWAAPEFAAMQAEIDQQCGASRWASPDLYRAFFQTPSAFVDVTNGSIVSPSGSTAFAAGPGYDDASGLGLPLGEEIAVQDGC